VILFVTGIVLAVLMIVLLAVAMGGEDFLFWIATLVLSILATAAIAGIIAMIVQGSYEIGLCKSCKVW